MNVMSVAGLLGANDLGRTLVHEHLVTSVPGEELDPNSGLDRAEIIAIAVDQLQKLKDHGITTLVDPCPLEFGRDPELYAEVSQRSGVNVIFSTGFYYEGLGIPLYWRARSAEEIAEFYLKEMTDGVGDTGLRPGVIKAATGVGGVKPAEHRCLTAAAMVQKEMGCAIITHTEHSQSGDDQQRIFAEGGADVRRVLIGHQDEQTSPDPIVKIAEGGSFVGMDRIGLGHLASDEVRADNVAAVVKAGFVRHVCMSHDCVCTLTAPRFPFSRPADAPPLARPQDWTLGRVSMTYLLTDFVPMLKARGVTDDDIDVILRDNPRRLLTGVA